MISGLQRIYRSVDDIDLFPGGIAETPLKGAVLGHTFICIVGDQFTRLKMGDRYFYDLQGQAGSFTAGKKKTQILKSTFYLYSTHGLMF